MQDTPEEEGGKRGPSQKSGELEKFGEVVEWVLDQTVSPRVKFAFIYVGNFYNLVQSLEKIVILQKLWDMGIVTQKPTAAP